MDGQGRPRGNPWLAPTSRVQGPPGHPEARDCPRALTFCGTLGALLPGRGRGGNNTGASDFSHLPAPEGGQGPRAATVMKSAPGIVSKTKAGRILSPFNHLMAETPDTGAPVPSRGLSRATVTTAKFGPASPYYSGDTDAHN